MDITEYVHRYVIGLCNVIPEDIITVLVYIQWEGCTFWCDYSHASHDVTELLILLQNMRTWRINTR